MTKMFYFKPHAVLFVSAGVLAFICRCARTNKREGGEKKMENKITPSQAIKASLVKLCLL